MKPEERVGELFGRLLIGWQRNSESWRLRVKGTLTESPLT